MLIKIANNEANVTDAIIVCNQSGKNGFNRTRIMLDAIKEANNDGLTILGLTERHIIRAMTNIAKQKRRMN